MTINLTALQKQRRDTAANWTGANPTLLAGEIGIESDTNKIKIGDGSTAWTSLSYTTWSQISAYPIVNADVAAAAAIAYSKLATLTSGNIVLGSSANVATSTAVTGDVTISNTGVTAIATGVIVNADINASAAIADTKLGTISTALKVSNSATTATDANTASAIVARDASGNFTAGTITANLTGTASNVTTNANLTGDVTSVGNATTIAAGVIVDADINASAAIVDTKLATIATAGKVSNSATTATSANTASAIVARDASGNFTAGTITATLTGNASTVTTNANLTGDVTSVGNATTIAAGVIVNADVNASAAIAGTKVAPDFGSQTVITTGSALIGTATSLSTLYSGAGKLQAASNDATTIQSYAFSSTGVDYSATLELSRARNTQASPAIVANGDYIGQINFAGYNTNFQRGATIYALVDGEPGTAGDTTDMPGKLVFATTPNGSATPTTRMSIDASGNVAVDTDTLYVDAVNNRVGIGTSSPAALLHLSATAGNQELRFSDTTNSAMGRIYENNGLVIISETNHGISFQTSATARGGFEAGGNFFIDTNTLYVDATNNRVGIGSTAPSQLLEIKGANARFAVNSTTVADGGILLQGNGTTYAEIKLDASSGILDIAEKQAAGNITFSTGTTPTERARVDSSGRLLVGTSSAAGVDNTTLPAILVSSASSSAGGRGIQCVHYGGTTDSASAFIGLRRSRGTVADNYTSVQNGDALGAHLFYGSDGSGWVPAASIAAYVDSTTGTNDMPGRLVFSTTADGASSPTERMRLGNSGNAEFFVSAAALSVRASGGSTSTNNALSITSGATGTTDGTLRFVVETRGNVFNQNNAYGSLSDVKLKENIVDASSQWSDLKNLKVRKYNFKEIPGHTQIGLVAQEVELVSPGLVSESPDRDEEGNDLGTVTKSVSYSVLYMKAVKALQEAMERIEQLETSNTDLLTRVIALEAN